MKTLLLLTVILLGVLAPDVSAQIPGGFSRCSKTNENVIAAAKFAVNAHDPKLEFKAIEDAESQVVAGTNYRITLTVIDKEKIRRADVVVWRKLGKTPTYELTSWKWRDGDPGK